MIALARHSGIAIPFARAQGQRFRFLVPVKRNARIFAVEILAADAVILVQREAAVGAGIDVERQRRMRVVAGELDRRASRDDRAGADEQRHPLVRRVDRDRLTAVRAAPGVKVVPVRTGGQIHLAASRLILGYGSDQERRPKQIFVAHIPHALVGGEIHHQPAHDRSVLEVSVGAERVDVGHQPVAQLVVPDHRAIGRRRGRRHFENLALDVLAVAAEDRGEGPELEPAGVELPPFGKVRRARLNEAILHRVAADVVAPIGHARHREIDPGRNLFAQIVPPRCDVARPDRGTRALDSAKARTGQNERPDVGLVGKDRS